VAVVLLVSVLLFKLSDVTDALGKQQALLTAPASGQASGARCCRACLAPLDVPLGAIGVRCAYCRADSLVSLPASMHAPPVLGAQPTTLDQAAAAVAAPRPFRPRPLLRAAAGAIVLGLLPIGAAHVTSHQIGGSWWSEVRGARRAYRVSGEPEVVAPGQTTIVPYCTPSGVRRRGQSRPDTECGVQIALRRGEALAVTLSSVSPRTTVSFYELDAGSEGDWPVVRSREVQQFGGTVDRVETFVAPYGGWFVFAVVDARAGMLRPFFDDAKMTWSLVPGG
jgi:LSD1 subclass zinc finger protein